MESKRKRIQTKERHAIKGGGGGGLTSVFLSVGIASTHQCAYRYIRYVVKGGKKQGMAKIALAYNSNGKFQALCA